MTPTIKTSLPYKRRECSEDAESQLYRSTEGLMYVLDSRGTRKDSYSKTFFTRYCILAPSKRAINLWYQSSCDCSSLSCRRGDGRPAVDEGNHKQIEEKFRADQRRVPQNLVAVVRTHHKTAWYFYATK